MALLARILLSSVRCTPSAAVNLETAASSKAATLRTFAASFSTSCVLQDSPNNPGKSGDRGPGKNYRKKMLKKRNKVMGKGSAADLSGLLAGLKQSEEQPHDAQSFPAGHITSLMKGTRIGVSERPVFKAQHKQRME